MATQHPDSASKYVPIQEEPAETLEALTPQPDGLGIEEVMIDFEGKMTPYHQTAEVAHKLIDAGLTPGKDVFITPRISSATEETVFRQIMALMSIIEADYDIMRARRDGCIKEIILPMVKGADDLLDMRRRIADVLALGHKEFNLSKDPNSIQIIPLLETVPTILDFPSFYMDYLNQAKEKNIKTNYLRFMIGRSDSALTFGLVPSALSAKLIVEKTFRIGMKSGFKVYPVIGGGALPFRGHISLENIENIYKDFRGVRTVTIQSGLRYDHDIKETKKLINSLRQNLSQEVAPEMLNEDDVGFIKNIICLFSSSYIKYFKKIVDVTVQVSDLLPKQRDRLTRKSPVGYARSSDPISVLEKYCTNEKVRALMKEQEDVKFEFLPRAIAFTGALYSMGLPPEFLGLGSGLDLCMKIFGKDGIDRLCDVFTGLKKDIEFASNYLYFPTCEKFFGKDFCDEIKKEIVNIEKYLGIEVYEKTNPSYATLTEICEPLIRSSISGIELTGEDSALLKTCLERLGKLRGSLG